MDLVTEKTDYGQLEKCYTIFICRDRIPKKEQMSISFYKIVNAKNVGECHPKEEDYDLMTLVIIRLGDKEYHSEEKNLLDFLTIIFQPHQKGFREKLSRYISFKEVLEVKEEKHMIGLGLSIYEEGIEQGIERGMGLNLFLLICKKLAKGKTIPEIAEALEEPEDVIQELCKKAIEFAPEYDEEKIREGFVSSTRW